MPSVPFVIILSSLYQWTSKPRGHPENEHSKSSGFLFLSINSGVSENQTTFGPPRVGNIFTRVSTCLKELSEFERSHFISRVMNAIKANFPMIVTMTTIAKLQKRLNDRDHYGLRVQ